MTQKNQLWILLGFFGLIGIFAGLSIWQINQSQQRDRELSKVKTELEQTTQQMKILKEQNTASLSDRGKLVKELNTAKKMAQDFQQKGLAQQQQLKAALESVKNLTTENSQLKLQQLNGGKTDNTSPASAGTPKSAKQPQPEPTGPARAEPLSPDTRMCVFEYFLHTHTKKLML